MSAFRRGRDLDISVDDDPDVLVAEVVWLPVRVAVRATELLDGHLHREPGGPQSFELHPEPRVPARQVEGSCNALVA
jgi:hypothetical protein